MPAPVGKTFESLRAFLKKQEGARGPLLTTAPRPGGRTAISTGTQSVCSIVIVGGRLTGIVALDAVAQGRIGWSDLSDVAKRARKMAHGTPALLWLDVPLDGTGAADFKALLKAKLGALPRVPPPPPPPASRE